MATYLQGVTDYIPQFQPFQPDLNFYANVMQTKQTQYDTNWKALNKMYNQYFYADLTRDGNIKKKDEYLKNIEFNLKRVSQLDLSLEQNVNQATQVFKPFYEDKGLMKDMAWTKNYNNQVGKAESFKQAYDEKLKGQYWDAGVRELSYLRDEFKNASDGEAMSFGNIQYTPYVNVIDKAQDIAKEANLSIESVNFSQDGKWIIKTKNGEQLTEPLSRLFEAQLGSDPGVQAVYKTQAYVNRKDYAYSNAAQFNGDKDAAEMKYLEDSFNVLKERSNERYRQLKEKATVYDNKIADIQKKIDNGTASPDDKKFLEQYKLNKEITDKVLVRAEEDNKQLNGGQSSTSTTSTGFQNPYGDLNSLRYKVDNGMASMLMQKDLDEAANIYAYTNAKQDIESNPYAVLAEKHKYSMQEVAARNAGLERAAKIRNAGERQNMIDKWKLDSGSYYRDEQTGEIKMIEGLDTIFNDNSENGYTDAINMKNTSRMIAQQRTENVAKPYLKNTLALINQLVKNGDMSRSEANEIISYSKGKGIDYKTFNDKMQKYGYNWIRGEVGSSDLAKIEQRMSGWLRANGGLSVLGEQQYKQYRESAVKFQDYTLYLKQDQDWRKKTSYEVESELRKQGLKNVDYLYDNDGNLRSESEYYRVLAEKGKGEKLSGKQSAANKLQALSNQQSQIVKEYFPKGQKGSNAIIYAQARNKAKSDPRYQEIETERKALTKKYFPNGVNAMELKQMANEGNYEELVKAAGQVYMSNRIKTPPPGLDQLGTLSGAGMFTTGINSTYVNPKAHGNSNKGNVWGIEALKTLSGIDWNDTNKNKVSFAGFSKTAFDKHGGAKDQGVAILEEIKREMMKGKPEMGMFSIGVTPIAAGGVRTAAVVIKPDAEWLKSKVYKTDKDGNRGAGIISEAQYNQIMRHGISYMTDSNNLSDTHLYKSTFQSPLQSYIMAGNEYTYTDPLNPDYNFIMSKNEFGTGDIDMTVKYPLWNPEKGKYEPVSVTSNMTTLGGNAEEARQKVAYDIFDGYKQLNIDLYNGNY